MSEKTVNGMHCITEAIHLIISNIIPFLNGTDLHFIIRKEKMEYLCSMLQCLFYRYVQIIVRLFSSQILQKATKGNYFTVSRLNNSSQPFDVWKGQMGATRSQVNPVFRLSPERSFYPVTKVIIIISVHILTWEQRNLVPCPWIRVMIG